jgi:hypothetical protein
MAAVIAAFLYQRVRNDPGMLTDDDHALALRSIDRMVAVDGEWALSPNLLRMRPPASSIVSTSQLATSAQLNIAAVSKENPYVAVLLQSQILLSDLSGFLLIA